MLQKIKNSAVLILYVTTLYAADITEADVNVSSNSYYSNTNLDRLTKEGAKKHAPLALILDQENIENPDNIALTKDFANMLYTGFVPILISRSIVYNYFELTERAIKRANKSGGSVSGLSFHPINNSVSFEKWRLYDVPNSQLFLFIPDYYRTHYKDNLGFNTGNLRDISTKLPVGQNYETIKNHIKSYKNTPAFSISNLRTVLTTITKNNQFTKHERKHLDQQPIWDIMLMGHGSFYENKKFIGDLSADQIQDLITFFYNELPVGVFYIQSCHAGGENLNLLEFQTTVNKEAILRNLDYILIVGAITDKPTHSEGEYYHLFYDQFYSNAARLQDKGDSLNRLLNNLTGFEQTEDALHGSNNIPQVWLPGGLGFQTYQINEKVQVIGNVKVRVHEDEHREIKLPVNTLAALLYTKNINVPLMIWPHKADVSSFEIFTKAARKHTWVALPTIAEFLQKNFYAPFTALKNRIAYNVPSFPALTYMLSKLTDVATFEELPDDSASFEKIISDALKLLYPEFISMLRGDRTTQYFNKIEIQQPDGKERELTGVIHFIRDAFFDIGERVTTKTFLIDELRGKNDLSVLLELNRAYHYLDKPGPNIRRHPKQVALFEQKKLKKYIQPTLLEQKLISSIGKQIELQKINITTSENAASLQFIFDDTAWKIALDLPVKEDSPGQYKPDVWELNQIDTIEYANHFDKLKGEIAPEPIEQKSIKDILLKKAAAGKMLTLK